MSTDNRLLPFTSPEAALMLEALYDYHEGLLATVTPSVTMRMSLITVITEVNAYYDLATKWGVDWASLEQTLHGLSDAEARSLFRRIQTFWEEPGGHFQAALTRFLRVFPGDADEDVWVNAKR